MANEFHEDRLHIIFFTMASADIQYKLINNLYANVPLQFYTKYISLVRDDD